jgi:hypothetical protein
VTRRKQYYANDATACIAKIINVIAGTNRCARAAELVKGVKAVVGDVDEVLVPIKVVLVLARKPRTALVFSETKELL